jgi:hypothetical protein
VNTWLEYAYAGYAALASAAVLFYLAALLVTLAGRRPRLHWPRRSWQVGPAWPGEVCAGWGHEIARFWNPRHLEDCDLHGYGQEYR